MKMKRMTMLLRTLIKNGVKGDEDAYEDTEEASDEDQDNYHVYEDEDDYGDEGEVDEDAESDKDGAAKEYDAD